LVRLGYKEKDWKVMQEKKLDDSFVVAPLLPYLSGLSTGAQSRVMTTLHRTVTGDEHDYVTPIIGRSNPDPDSVRERIIYQVLPMVASTGVAAIDEAEISQAQKIGPVSVMLPWDRRKEDLEKYYLKRDVSYLYTGLSYARDQLLKILPRNLRPVSVETAYANLPSGTNLGAPFFTKAREYRRNVLHMAKMIEFAEYPLSDDPCMLYWRGQSRGIGEVPKQRVVWGYPHYVTVHELRLQMALLPHLRDRDEFSALVSSEAVNRVITGMLKRAHRLKRPVLSIDFSGYDASVPKVLIDLAFEVMHEVFEDSAADLINYVHENFLDIGILTPDGIWLGRNGAIPSGSGLTNLIGGWIQKMLLDYIAWCLSNTLDVSTVQGDDGAHMFTRPWSIEDVSACAADLGIQVSSDKGGVSKDVVYFLQNIHTIDYTRDGIAVGVRPIMRVLNGMMSLERMHEDWVAEDHTIRWLQQAQAAKEHPMFTVLARFIYDHDSVIREMTVDEIVKRAGGLSEVKSVLKQQGFPYGKEPLSGLADFDIVHEIERIKRQASGNSGRGQ
jgi:hypothetical protein